MVQKLKGVEHFSQSISVAWAHTASLMANKPPEDVWGTFDAVAGTEAIAYRTFLELNDLVLWSNALSK